MIPRYQRILFGILLGSSVLMGVYLFRLHEKAKQKLVAMNDATPISAPSNSDAENITLEMANDADGSITATEEQIALPQETGIRARALLERLLSEYALPKSTHPLTGGPSVDDVFLLHAASAGSNDAQATPILADSGNDPLLAVINLHGAFAQSHPSGIQVEMLTLQSILGTLHANLPRIVQVRFLVDGRIAPTLAGHADLTRTYDVTDTLTRPADTKSVDTTTPSRNSDEDEEKDKDKTP